MDHPIGIDIGIEHELNGWDDVEEGDEEDLVYVGVRPTSSVPVIRLREGFI